jgi:hypothetical protein
MPRMMIASPASKPPGDPGPVPRRGVDAPHRRHKVGPRGTASDLAAGYRAGLVGAAALLAAGAAIAATVPRSLGRGVGRKLPAGEVAAS